jgi:hypothetical protein
MSEPSATPPRRPRLYGRSRQAGSTRVFAVLRPDALAAVDRVAAELGLTRSGAIHHLIRRACRLKSLLS